MKKPIYILVLSTLAIFTMSCDEATLAALTEAASSFLEKTPGCMNANNTNYNRLADEHVQDSCAVLSYGCMDSGALNFNEPCMTNDDIACTNTCQGIAAEQCCTTTTAGCTDSNYANYNENANNDDGSCAGAITFGCMQASACNHNPNATQDCNKQTPDSGDGNTNCCVSGSATETVCVQDLDNDDYQDSGSTSETLAVNNCGCGTLGYGWKDIEDTNGEAIFGCQNPSCPEFDQLANIDDGNCCLGFSALDSILMFGEDFADCVSDPTLCVETAEFSLMGGYIADMSDCEDQMMGPDNFHDELYVFLGWDGEYYEEFLSIHEVKGFRAPPRYEPAYDSPQACGDYAGSVNWFCGNQIANTDEYRPCQEEYFEYPCESRDECWWEGPECRWAASQWVGDACWQPENQATQAACTTDPGCQWDDGGFAEYGSVQWLPNCYFDCWGLSETGCGDTALADECWWKTPDSNDGYCSAPANTYDQCDQLGSSGGQCKINGIVVSALTTEDACNNAGVCTGPAGVDQSITNEPACFAAGYWWTWAYEVSDVWWDPGHSTCWGYENWDTGAFVCQCEVDNVNQCAGCEAECTAKGTGYTWQTFGGDGQCEQKPFEDACDSYGSSSDCNDAPAAENCKWDYQGGWCFKEQGAECWMESMQTEATCTASSDCEWWTPPGYNINNVPPEFQTIVADHPGICNFYDWCHDYYCWEGECNEADCKNDNYCRWDTMPGQPPQCVEDAQAQYCECYVEWSQSSCQADPNTSWDAMHHECMYNMDQNACYNVDDIMLGPEDGNIDCGAYVADNIEQYTEWNGIDGVCEIIFEDALEGTWSIVGNTLCIEKIGEFEEEACDLLYFEECQCNLHRCNWTPQPTFNDPDAGVCDEGSQDSDPGGGGRVQGVEHYKIKTVSPVFQDEMINYIFGNPPEECLSFSLQNNGDVHITMTKPDGQTCNIVFKPEGSDGS